MAFPTRTFGCRLGFYPKEWGPVSTIYWWLEMPATLAAGLPFDLPSPPHLKSIYVKLNFCVWIFVRATSHCGLSCLSWLHIIRSHPKSVDILLDDAKLFLLEFPHPNREKKIYIEDERLPKESFPLQSFCLSVCRGNFRLLFAGQEFHWNN